MAYTTIDKPTDYFNTKTYTGTATSSGDTQAVTGVGFQPDWVWIKNRDGAYQHVLYDVIRGVNKEVRSSQNIAEVDSGTNGYLSAFDSDGFTTTRGINTGNHVNASGSGFVSWNWLAGGSASSNTDGSITSSVSANTTAGFSIVSFTGNGTHPSTVGHGLGAVPQIVIVKARSEAQAWKMYNVNLGNNKIIELNATGASFTDNDWNSTTPTSSVFTVNNNNVNENTQTYIAYCFAEKKGYSKFGSYIGNGNADGTFVYTGFKPAWVMVKETGVGNWLMKDNKRPTYNQNDQYFYANGSNSEFTNSVVGMDFLSNGFKCRGTAGDMNGNGTTVLYMAFAESPFVTSTGIPTTGR